MGPGKRIREAEVAVTLRRRAMRASTSSAVSRRLGPRGSRRRARVAATARCAASRCSIMGRPADTGTTSDLDAAGLV